MDIKEQVRLRFQGVDIAKVNFAAKKRYTKDSNNKIEVEVDPKVFYPEHSETQFKILMEVSLDASEYFQLKLLAVGNFELTSKITEELKKSFINANAPAIMFPYVRAFISSFTATIGNSTGTVNIPPQAFSGTLEEVSH